MNVADFTVHVRAAGWIHKVPPSNPPILNAETLIGVVVEVSSGDRPPQRTVAYFDKES